MPLEYSSIQGVKTLTNTSQKGDITDVHTHICLLDRTPVSEHLPLAWTRSTDDEASLLMTRLEELRRQFLTAAEEQPATNQETSNNT